MLWPHGADSGLRGHVLRPGGSGVGMWQQLRSGRTARYGLPMLLLVVGGSFGLREFTQIRYDAQRVKRKLDPALEARVNSQKQSVILEEEYEKLKDLDLDGWRNIRGPRPWEDSKEFQNQQREQFSKGQ